MGYLETTSTITALIYLFYQFYFLVTSILCLTENELTQTEIWIKFVSCSYVWKMWAWLSCSLIVIFATIWLLWGLVMKYTIALWHWLLIASVYAILLLAEIVSVCISDHRGILCYAGGFGVFVMQMIAVIIICTLYQRLLDETEA